SLRWRRYQARSFRTAEAEKRASEVLLIMTPMNPPAEGGILQSGSAKLKGGPRRRPFRSPRRSRNVRAPGELSRGGGGRRDGIVRSAGEPLQSRDDAAAGRRDPSGSLRRRRPCPRPLRGGPQILLRRGRHQDAFLGDSP